MADFLAWYHTVGNDSMTVTLATSVATVLLGVITMIALRWQAQASRLAREEASRTRTIEARERARVQNLAKILEISNRINANLELEPLLKEIAEAIRQSLGFRMSLVRILDDENQSFMARAFAGIEEKAVQKLSASTVPVETFKTWMKDEFRISQSYFISHEHGFWEDQRDEIYIPDLGERREGEWHPMDSLFVPLWTRDQRLVGYLSVDDPEDRRIPSMETIETLEIFANQAVTAIENARLYGELGDHVMQLREMTRRLKELNEIKSNFVATVSHELRTPLTSIRAYAETLSRDWGSSPRETEVEFLKIIEEEAQRLSKIVEDMLDLSRMESGKVEVKKCDTDMSKVVEDSLQILAPTARKKYIDVKAETGEEPVEAYVDQGMLKQLILNLVGNAIKFTPEGGRVTVELTEQESAVELSVEDTGIGIPSGSAKKIFEEFYQVDSSATRRYGGVGLGLAIVKNIVDWHDGKIWVESDGGKGARFTVRLPKRKAIAAERSQAVECEETWQCERRIPELLVDMIAELMDAKAASLMLVNDECEELFVSAAMGLDEAIVKNARVKLGEGVSGYVASTGKPLLVRDIDADERFAGNRRPQYETRSLVSVPLREGNRVVGVINVTNKISLTPFTDDDTEMLQILADRVTAIIGKVRHYEGIKSEFGSIISSLRSLIDSRRMTQTRKGNKLTSLVVKLGRSAGLDDEEVKLLQYVSRIYDVGMVKVGEGILRKRGGLRVGEYESVKRHPEEGVDIVGPIEILEQVKEVILHHHERFDGGGYPGGLSGECIPVGARILAVVDSYSSMLSDRAYRPALSAEEAIEELRRCRGTQFDPKIVDKFVEILQEHEAGKRIEAAPEPEKGQAAAQESEAEEKETKTPVGAGIRR
ncbi:HD domain-containing phosphohydrolase [Candidatus Eisenbacteria bacterium]|uniref:histidine kinase n=1 Tax=Eiseniibacteriota bacterium TaxID=2212470 RepID=A0ABV6YPV7_UNCEI